MTDDLKAQLDQAYDLQAATSEVLQVISDNPGDVDTVLDGLLHQAVRLCRADAASLSSVREGFATFIAASHEQAKPFIGAKWPLAGSIGFGEAGERNEVASVPDARGVEWPDALKGMPPVGTLLSVPLFIKGHHFGQLILSRFEVDPFDEHETRVLRAFADQAAVAIANAQLFTDLDESLELQTATSEILRLIASNPGDLGAVFRGIVTAAAALCDADSGTAQKIVGDELEFVAASNDGGQRLLGTRVARSHVSESEPTFYPDVQEIVGVTDSPVRSLLTVPVLSGRDLFGQITVTRFAVRPFEERHGRILQTFAKQAEIAISNAKLFSDLDQALARQQAMTNVLDAVSTARTDLQPVFDAIALHGSQLCGSGAALVALRAGDHVHYVAASHGQAAVAWADHPLDNTSASGQSILSGLVVAVSNWDSRPADQLPDSPVPRSAGTELATIPMLRGGVAVGAISFTRKQSGGFTDAEITLLQAFANQAAVAVDNAHLLREIEERNVALLQALELQTATSEVLRLISANPGNARAVFDGIIERAAVLCGATGAAIVQYENGIGTYLASLMDPGLVGQSFPAPEPYDDVPQRYVTDFREIRQPDQHLVPDIRSTLTVDLRRGDDLYGLLTLTRLVVQPFVEREGAIAQAFADQAAIAIENAQMFSELQNRTHELHELNENLAQRVDDGVREVGRLNTLRRFVSPQLAEAIASGGESVLASHRREITVLFCDLRGFTSFAELAEPEEVMDVLREFHHAVGPMIFEHHGTIAQFTGDGMLVFFNDPVPLDDPAWEAVQLAIRMRDRTAELSDVWRRRGHELTLGIGIAVGFATCGEIGFEGRTEYTAIGTVVNLAARICGIAAGGQILVTNKVQAALADRVPIADLGGHEFKGLSRPVPLFDIAPLG